MGTVGQVTSQGLWKVHPTPKPAPQHQAFGSPWGPLEAFETPLYPGLSASSGLSSSTALQPFSLLLPPLLLRLNSPRGVPTPPFSGHPLSLICPASRRTWGTCCLRPPPRLSSRKRKALPCADSHSCLTRPSSPLLRAKCSWRPQPYPAYPRQRGTAVAPSTELRTPTAHGWLGKTLVWGRARNLRFCSQGMLLVCWDPTLRINTH